MSEKLRILVVDDDRSIRRFLRASLGGEYDILEACNGEETLLMTTTGRPDAILLDLGLPDLDGVEVTRRLREWTQIPIIVLSVRDREEDKIAALDAGADDYLTKPFGIGELTARLRVAFRRALHPEEEPVYQAGRLVVNLNRREVLVDGLAANLTPTEYDILRVLIQHAGKVLTHQQLIHLIWGNSFNSDDHLLRVNISNLRRKIEADPTRPCLLMTEPAVGYRLVMAETIQR